MPSVYNKSKKPLLTRGKPACKIQHRCQSCSHVNSPYDTSYQKKYQQALAGIQERVSLDAVEVLKPQESSRVFGYRTSVKLAIRKAFTPLQRNRSSSYRPEPQSPRGRFEIGLFEPRSHRVVSIEECPVQHTQINRLVKETKYHLNKSDLTPYCEKTQTGDLRYLLIRMAHVSEEFMITFVATNKSCYPALRKLVKQLKINYNITSSFLNTNSENTNRILGEQSKKIIGKEKLRETLCNFNLQISPQSFFQVNPWVAQKIYHRVQQLVGHNTKTSASAWDLYSGVGIFSLIMAKAGYKVMGIEENPFASKDAYANAEENNMPARSLYFKDQSVEDFFQETSQEALNEDMQKPDVIVVNPSRKGLSESVNNGLIAQKKANPDHRLIYISCEADSLSKNLKTLTEGGYKLRQLESFDMFPHTEKIEWIAVLD